MLTCAVNGWRIRVIHGGVHVVNRFIFASQRDAIAEELQRAAADVVIAGRAGIPFIENIAPGRLVQPGVIGMAANDGTPEVWYGRISLESGDLLLSTRRLGYDHHAAAAAMRRAGHANGYARTLVTGLWPSLDVLPPAERAATGRTLLQRTARVRAPAEASASPLRRLTRGTLYSGS